MDYEGSPSQLIKSPFLSILDIGLLILAKFVTNLLKNCTFLKNDCIPLTFFGLETLPMVTTPS